MRTNSAVAAYPFLPRHLTLISSLTIGILPTSKDRVSRHVDVPIITEMGNARNNVNVMSSNVVVACGLTGAGTVSEVALALTLLTGGGLLLQTFLRLQAADLGFDPRNVIQVELAARSIGIRPEQVPGLHDELLGFVVLKHSLGDVTFNWEVSDLLKVAESCGVVHPALISTDDVDVLYGDQNARRLWEVYGYQPGWGKPAEAICREVISIPLNSEISNDSVDYVIDVLRRFRIGAQDFEDHV